MTLDIQAAHIGGDIFQTFASSYGIDRAVVGDLLRETCFKQVSRRVTDNEITSILIVAHAHRLNPFTREIYATFDELRDTFIPTVGVDGWIRIINEHPQFNGVEFEYGPPIESGKYYEWIDVIIHRKDRDHPTRVREFWDEVSYDDGAWKTHPRRMHRHKTLTQGGRVAFGLVGIYDEDEARRIVKTQSSKPAQAAPLQMPQSKSAAAPEPAATEGKPKKTGKKNSKDPSSGADSELASAGTIKLIETKLKQKQLIAASFCKEFDVQKLQGISAATARKMILALG